MALYSLTVFLVLMGALLKDLYNSCTMDKWAQYTHRNFYLHKKLVKEILVLRKFWSGGPKFQENRSPRTKKFWKIWSVFGKKGPGWARLRASQAYFAVWFSRILCRSVYRVWENQENHASILDLSEWVNKTAEKRPITTGCALIQAGIIYYVYVDWKRP